MGNLCKIIAACAAIMLSFGASAQTMTAESMTALPMDLSASVNARKDLNGKPCALVKVSITVSNATFGGDVVGDVSRDGSDYWVYMTGGSKMLQIKHPNFKSLMVVFPNFGIARLEGKQTYALDISLPAVAYVEPVAPAQEVAAPSKSPDAAVAHGPRYFKPRKIKNHKEAFFPIFGITLGETTYSDAFKMGYIKDAGNFGDKYDLITIQGNSFWTHFSNTAGNEYDHITVGTMPQKWADYGFDKSLSYNEWIALFESLGFRVDIEKEPVVGEYDGRDVLQANLRATDPAGTFYFTLQVDYGSDGSTVDSPNTLYDAGIEVFSSENKALNAAIAKTRNASKKFVPSPAIDTFFPIYGITLGKSTWYDMARAGNMVESNDDGNAYCRAHDLLFSDFGKNGVFSNLYITDGSNMPPAWIKLGLQWGNSYNTWKKLFEDMGYTVIVEKAPAERGGNFSADLRVISPDARLRMDLEFDFRPGRDDTPGTLYSISMTAQ